MFYNIFTVLNMRFSGLTICVQDFCKKNLCVYIKCEHFGNLLIDCILCTEYMLNTIVLCAVVALCIKYKNEKFNL